MAHPKQRNVQQQNAVARDDIVRTAMLWRKQSIPAALRTHGESKGIEWRRAVVLQLEIDFPGMPALFGRLLTQAQRFVYFELETDADHAQVLSEERWDDVTEQVDLCGHNKGTGKGNGLLALEVQAELNS